MDSAFETAAEFGPWRIARENGMAADLSLPEIAATWAEEVEPDDYETQEAVEAAALRGFDRFLSGGVSASHV